MVPCWKSLLNLTLMDTVRSQAGQELYCVEGCGIPKPAEAVVQERATALAAAQRLGQEAAGPMSPYTCIRCTVRTVVASSVSWQRSWGASI